MSELKPCPFCGGKAITSTFFDWDDLDYMAFEVNDNESIDGEVTCENERCINGWYLSPKDWNTRPIEDDLRNRIAELEGKFDQLTARWRQERQDDKWIPVSERLPEVYRDEDGERIPFLVCEGDGGHPFVARYNGVNWWAGIFVPDITHWMPLPELPKESK